MSGSDHISQRAAFEPQLKPFLIKKKICFWHQCPLTLEQTEKKKKVLQLNNFWKLFSPLSFVPSFKRSFIIIATCFGKHLNPCISWIFTRTKVCYHMDACRTHSPACPACICDFILYHTFNWHHHHQSCLWGLTTETENSWKAPVWSQRPWWPSQKLLFRHCPWLWSGWLNTSNKAERACVKADLSALLWEHFFIYLPIAAAICCCFRVLQSQHLNFKKKEKHFPTLNLYLN